MYESYRSFASVYDEFMDGTDYQLTADKIQDMITRYGVSKPSQKRTGTSEARDVLLAAEKNGSTCRKKCSAWHSRGETVLSTERCIFART